MNYMKEGRYKAYKGLGISEDWSTAYEDRIAKQVQKLHAIQAGKKVFLIQLKDIVDRYSRDIDQIVLTAQSAEELMARLTEVADICDTIISSE